MKTLLAIKDQEILNVIITMLDGQGFRFYYTTKSHDAIEILARGEVKIEFLIASLNIQPEGAEPIVRMARAENPDLPVLLIAGSQSETDRERIECMDVVFWETGSVRAFIPSVHQALYLSSRITIRFLWEVASLAEEIFQRFPISCQEECDRRDAFLAEYTSRLEDAKYELSRAHGINLLDIQRVPMGTVLLKNTRKALVGLYFWLECQKGF